MKARSFRQLYEQAERDPAYWTELAILEVAEEIYTAMQRAGVSRAELARRLGTSPAYVTKILRGSANFTLESLARLAHALGGEFKFHIAPPGMTTRWLDVASRPERPARRPGQDRRGGPRRGRNPLQGNTGRAV